MSRGIVADPAQILIVAGIQEGLNIAARLFLSPDTTAGIENPCYEGASQAFAAAGARLVFVEVDEQGIITSLLPNEPMSLLYVTPAHQYPTGHALSLARRMDLIAWARRNRCYLVEDDYDSEFQYEGSPLQALAGMAPDCTIHLGTFSTTLGAGLRLGYVVAPPDLVDVMRATKALLNSGNPWLDQAVLAEFVRSGSYATHLTRCRSQYRESRDALLGALRRHFGTVEISGEAAGLHVLWRLPAGVPEATRLRSWRVSARSASTALRRPARASWEGRLRTTAACSWATRASSRSKSSRASRACPTPWTTHSTTTTTSFASYCWTSLPIDPLDGARAGKGPVAPPARSTPRHSHDRASSSPQRDPDRGAWPHAHRPRNLPLPHQGPEPTAPAVASSCKRASHFPSIASSLWRGPGCRSTSRTRAGRRRASF